MGVWNGIELDDLVLTGDGLTLRPWRASDAPAVFSAVQDPQMARFLPIPQPYTREDARAFVGHIGQEGRGAGTGLGCAVTDSASGELLGACALRMNKPGSSCPDIGYWVTPSARGRGVAGRASRLLAQWGLAGGLRRIEILCDVTNLASARAALSAGFRFEGIQRGSLRAPQADADAAMFARLATDTGAPITPWLPALPADGLADDVLHLRGVQPGDAAALFDEASDSVSVGWGFTGVAPDERDIAAGAAAAGLHWLVGPSGRLVMVERASGSVAGSLVIRAVGPPGVGGIGYGVRPGFRGHGYTTRALRLLVPWAFGPGGYTRLELGAKRANVASQKAAQAAGFEPDGVRAARLRNPDGSFSDEVRFALVNPASRRV